MKARKTTSSLSKREKVGFYGDACEGSHFCLCLNCRRYCNSSAVKLKDSMSSEAVDPWMYFARKVRDRAVGEEFWQGGRSRYPQLSRTPA